jgi:predicted nucleotidyltransferase
MERVILFGSAARREMSEDSDIDILDVANDHEGTLNRELAGGVADLLLQYRHYLSIKVYDQTRLRKFQRLQTPLIKNLQVDREAKEFQIRRFAPAKRKRREWRWRKSEEISLFCGDRTG